MRNRAPAYDRRDRQQRGDTSRRAGGNLKIRDDAGNSAVAQGFVVGSFSELEDEDEVYINGFASLVKHFTNAAGATLARGTVVVIQADGTVTTTTTPQDTRPVGVVAVETEDGELAPVTLVGYVEQLNTTASVTAGNYAETSTTAGQATESATRRVGSFAQFLTTGANPEAYLFGVTDAVTGTGSGGGLPWVYAQADGGLHGDDSDDQTLMQSLFDDATEGGTKSAWIWLEPGVYTLPNAPQDTGAFNGQIILPHVVSPNPLITITIQAAHRPQWRGPGEPWDADIAVIKSTRTGGTGTAAVISGGNGISNHVQVVMRDILCVGPDDPSLTFLNLSATADGITDGVLVGTTGVWPGPANVTEPSNAHAYGIKLPAIANSSITRAGAFVLGYYNGVKVGELTHGDLNVWLCKVGVELGRANHPNDLRIQSLSCPTVIKTGDGVTYTDILLAPERANLEYGGVSSPAWAVQEWDLDDVNNYLHGHLRVAPVLQGLGPSYSFKVRGGANASWQQFGRIPKPSGTLLLASDAGDPIVFDDILQASDAADFLYASEPAT